MKYDSTTFKPAVANLYSNQNARKSSLEEALNSLYRDQRNQATGIQQTEISREEQQRQFDANLAWQHEQLARQEAMQKAANAAAGSYFGRPTGGAAPTAAAAPSAPQGFRDVLSSEAAKGNQAAKIALPFVGNDGKYWFDPNQHDSGYSQEVLNALNAIGAKNAYTGGIKGTYKEPSNLGGSQPGGFWGLPW